MSEDSTRSGNNWVNDDLTYYKQLAVAMAEEGRFDEALDLLKKAERFAASGDDLSLLKATRDDIVQRRNKQASQHYEELRRLMRQDPQKVKLEDLGRGEELLTTLRNMDQAKADALEGDWRGFRRHVQAEQALLGLREDLERFWKAPELALYRYDQAVQLAERNARDFADDPRFQELLAEAKKRREQAYRAEQFLVTQAMQGELGRLYDELKALAAEGREVPWYEWGTREIEGKPARVPLPVLRTPPPEPQEALNHFLTEIAAPYEEGKANEYRQRAEEHIEQGDPEGADDLIKRALDFRFISDSKKEDLQLFQKEKVAPALQRRERANKLVAEAEQKITKDPEQAWNLIQEALRQDPSLQRSEQRKARDIQDALRSTLKVRWRNALNRADRDRRSGRFEDAQAAAARIRDMAQEDPELQEIVSAADQLIALCVEDAQLFQYVTQEAKRIIGLVTDRPDEAELALLDLESKVSGRALIFQGPLQSVRLAFQAKQSVEKLVRYWERRLEESDPARLDEGVYGDAEAMRAILNSLIESEEESATPLSAKELEAVRKRLQARRHYLEGRADWAAGRFNNAKSHWQRVLELQGDDVRLAGEWLAKADDAVQVSEALKEASGLHERKKYQEAMKLLDPWRTKSSPLQNAVNSLYDSCLEQLRRTLLEDIHRLVQGFEEHPLYTQFISRVKELEEIDPQTAEHYKVKYFPKVYQELGDAKKERGALEEAFNYYESGLECATGQMRAELAKKARQTRILIYRKKAEGSLRKGDREGARKELEVLVAYYPESVEDLARLANIAMGQGDGEGSLRYISAAERQLEEAQQRGDPSGAGFEHQEEIAEWQSRLGYLRVEAESLQKVQQALAHIQSQMQPGNSVREYSLARISKDNLISELKSSLTSLGEVPATLPGLARERVWQAREKTRNWLNMQITKKIPESYEKIENELFRRLREEFAKTAALKIEEASFLTSRPDHNIRSRWEIGLKLLFLFPEGQERNAALLEMYQALSSLRDLVRRIREQRRGPEMDLDGNSLSAWQALEQQIEWSENLRAWSSLLWGFLSDLTSATGREYRRDEAKELYESIEACVQALHDLRNRASQVENRLERAIEAGNDPQHHWGRVNWRLIVQWVLSSSEISSTRMERETESPEEERRRPWADLDHLEPQRRLACWRKAAEALAQSKLAGGSQGTLWNAIDKIIQEAGINEGWEYVLSPLDDVLQQFGEHRLVEDLRNRCARAHEVRNELVMNTADLYAFVQAEEWKSALSCLDRLKNLDRERKYGFFDHVRIDSPQGDQPISLADLRKRLEDQVRQYEAFHDWYAEVEKSALPRWRDAGRQEVIALARKGEFERAIELCQDALEGKTPDGLTNKFGGGLALRPLLTHLQKRPAALAGPALSQLVKAGMARAESDRHDAEEFAREITSWLSESDADGSMMAFPRPLPVLQREYKHNIEGLNRYVQDLKGMSARFRWQKRKKEEFREFCRGLLEDAKKIAPDSPELADLERQIEEA